MKRTDLILRLAVLGSQLYDTALVHGVANHQVQQ
jgi:hypothetical protein